MRRDPNARVLYLSCEDFTNAFIQSIQSTLTEAQDYHIMVVDTDAQWGGECELLCPLFFNTCPDIPQYPCGIVPDACNSTLGAGVVHTMASDAPNVPCDFTTGARYMDSSEPDLTSAFQCAAKVGSDGDGSERQMGAMVGALSPVLAEPGACNEGFVRQDAILVVTLITDEEDDGDSLGDPATWKQALVAAKGGNEAAVVVLGLVGDPDVMGGTCGPLGLAEPSPRLRTFAESLQFGSWGSICAADYAPFFADAVEVIDSACEQFDPEG